MATLRCPTTDVDTGSTPSARVFTFPITMARPARRLCEDGWCGHTCERLPITPPCVRAGGDGCQRDGVERRWDDWKKAFPELANCSNEKCNGASPRLTFFRQAVNIVFLLLAWTSSTPLIPDAYIYLPECNSLSLTYTSYTFPLYNAPKITRGFNRARACTGPAQSYIFLLHCLN